MAYCTSGSGFYSHDYKYPDGYPDPSIKWFTKVEWQWQSITCNEDSCLYVKKTIKGNFTNYDIFCVKRKSGTNSVGKRTYSKITHYSDDSVINEEHSQEFYTFQVFKVGQETLYNNNKPVINTYGGTISIPVFDNEEEISKYIQTGDDSGKIKFFNTDWKLYIDGKSNPLYKLTWNCEGLKDADTSYTTIAIWVGTYNVLDDTFNDDDGTKFKEVDYNKHSVKFSYSDLEKLVPKPLIGHNPPSIRVQLAYREFPTARVETSTSMGCEVYFDSHPQNTLYTELGYLTMENGTWHRTTDGDGSTFTVKDGQAGSDGYTEDNDNGYNDGKDNDEKDTDTGDVSAGIGVLTSTFKMTKERLVQLGQFLWGSNIFDKFSLVNNNPIENIISCKSIPINTDGANQEIILGNVSTGVNGEKISNNFAKQTIGSIAITEHYHNFLDYAPYTNVILYLPYIGFKELDTTLVMNKTLQVIYTVDAITGGCLAQVYANSVRLYEFTGNVGIDIPITASNRAQVEAGYIQAGVGATASALGGNIGSAVTSLLNSATSQYHYSSTGNPSPMCVASTNRTCYVILDRPNYQNLKAFNHTRGRKCYLSKTISTLKGFTICDSNIDLSGINATDTEKEEIVNILSTGFFA